MAFVVHNSVDPAEVAYYSRLAQTWWDESGPFWPLHRLNALRTDYIRDALCRAYSLDPSSRTPLRGLEILDVGKLDLDECLTSRDKINSELGQVMDDATDKWGVKVNRVELKDITPPHDIQQAMEKQMRAERDRRAAILNAEGEKKSAILEILC